MKVARVIVDRLVQQGVPCVYEMCGGMITHLLDALGERPEIRVVSVHHEQAAAFAAEAGARMSGIPAVAMATSGPGATNLLTGIASCYFDSVPAVFITGQVNRNELRGVRTVRQVGFQETDIVSMAKGITKAALLLDDPDHVGKAIDDAFTLAMSGRPGPVLLDIPMDVQRAEVDAFAGAHETPALLEPAREQVAAALALLARASRPLLLVGGGVRAARAHEAFREFARLVHVPVVYSLLGMDAMASEDSLSIGLIGTYGNRWANLALGRSDLVMVLGSRLDVRQTGSDRAGFAAGKQLIQIDVDASELDNGLPGVMSILADLGAFLRVAITEAAGSGSLSERSTEWHEEIADFRRRFPDEDELADMPGVNPARLLRALSTHAVDASAFIADVGQNQMWAAQSLRLGPDQRFISSAGLGAMGFALPAAIGVALVAPGRPVVVISGDGGMQVNVQELETIARLGLPAKIVVLNNHCLGMVRQFQDEYFGARYQSTVWGYGAPDFVAVAQAFGIRAMRLEAEADTDDALEWLLAAPTLPALVEVSISSASRVRPKVTFGKVIFDMEPPPGSPAESG